MAKTIYSPSFGIHTSGEANPAEGFALFVLRPFLHEALQLPLEGHLGRGGHAINKEDAIEMIDLVLERPSEQSVRLPGLGFAAEVLKRYLDSGGAADVTPQPRKAQTTFLVGFLVFTELDFRIQKHHRHSFRHDCRLAIDAEV